MQEKPKDRLTQNELSVIQVLWAEKRPLSRPEILSRIPEHSWNPNSIHLILNSLIKKQFIAVDGMTKCGQGYGRTYAPTVTQEDFAAACVLRLTPNLSPEQRLLGLVSSLINQDGVTSETIERLEALLQSKKREIEL